MSGGGGDAWSPAPCAARGAFGFFSDKLPPLVKVVFFTGGMVRILFSTSLCEGGGTRETVCVFYKCSIPFEHFILPVDELSASGPTPAS